MNKLITAIFGGNVFQNKYGIKDDIYIWCVTNHNLEKQITYTTYTTSDLNFIVHIQEYETEI